MTTTKLLIVIVFFLKQKHTEIGYGVLTVDVLQRGVFGGIEDVNTIALHASQSLVGHTTGLTSLLGADLAQMTATAAKMQELIAQQGFHHCVDLLAQLGMGMTGFKHSLNIKTVFNFGDGLIKNTNGGGMYLLHQRLNLTDVRGAHPASAIAAALITGADFPEVGRSNDLALRNDDSFCGTAVQNGL